MTSLPPGPWHAEPHRPGSEMWSVYAPNRDDAADSDDLVCVADYLFEDVARFVAAAPDILEALKELVAAHDARADADSVARARSDGRYERARAAIALVEGKP
jgi:hypothetical protein